MMKCMKWIIGNYSEQAASLLEREMKIPSLAAKLLVARGFETPEAAEAFTKKDINELHDPFLFTDMEKAVARIRLALEKNEKIAVYGDYDADGVTATYILLHYLKSVGADCIYHIPDRAEDGYGVAKGALLSLSERGVTLVITVDTGITAWEETDYAKELGIDIIITDHHKCGDTLPSAYAVVNPNREDCGYPFKMLAGVGVAFKLISALSENDSSVRDRYLPYVCIGTVADVMPLVGENRLIVSAGLEGISPERTPGIAALLVEAGVDKGETLTAGAVGFLIGPRINAAGRMSSATLALELLLATDCESAAPLARSLSEKNRERQQCEGEIMREAADELAAHPEYSAGSAIVIDRENWHHGVLGIVASRLCAQLGKPVILISTEDGDCKGSGRSVVGVSLHAALCKCASLLEKYGGHELAAGISIRRENIPEFRRRLNDALEAEMRDYTPTVSADFRVNAEELTLSQLRAMRVMEPYGKENEAPRLCLENCKVARISPIGGNRHLRIEIERGMRLRCMYFGKSADTIPFSEGDCIDVIFTPEINTYSGESVQLHIKDARPCRSELETLELAIDTLCELRNGNADGSVRFTYKELGVIWRSITRSDFDTAAPLMTMLKSLRHADSQITAAKLLSALEIFAEVGLLTWTCECLRVKIDIVPENKKVSLEDSATYNILMNCRRR